MRQRSNFDSYCSPGRLEANHLAMVDSTCPICFTTYLAIIAEGELASVMDSPANPAEHHGVTKLSKPWQCGHMFCKRE